MANYKAEAFAKILEEAKEAKPVLGKENAYSPEEYQKVYKREALMANMAEGDIVKPHIPIGSVEFNPDGSLRAIARNRSALFDVARYTSNRYMKRVITEQEAEKEDCKFEAGIYILVIWGEGFVDAAVNTKELPETVRAFRFKKSSKGIKVTPENKKELNLPKNTVIGSIKTITDWVYVDTERIGRDMVYQMKGELDSDSMLKLIQKLEEHTTLNSENITKDNLDEI